MNEGIETLLDFGENIRNIRKSKKMNLRDFSKLSGLHHNYLSELERGKRNVSFETMQKLSKALEMPMKSLFEKKK